MKLLNLLTLVLPLVVAFPTEGPFGGRLITDPHVLKELELERSHSLDKLKAGEELYVTAEGLTKRHDPDLQKRLGPIFGLAGVAIIEAVAAGTDVLSGVIGNLISIFLSDAAEVIWTDTNHCRSYLQTHAGGEEHIRTYKHGSSSSNPEHSFNSGWPKPETEDPPVHYFEDEGVGRYSVQFTATDKYAWDGIEGTEKCYIEGLCNPQYMFYHDGYTIILNAWQSQGSRTACQYSHGEDCKGLCMHAVKDQFTTNGVVWGGDCAIPCQGDGGSLGGGTGTLPGIPTGEPKFMVVGDSISHGAEGDFTWRYRLWKWLKRGYNVNFVGPWTGTNGPIDPKFAKPVPPAFPGESVPIFEEIAGIYDRDAYQDKGTMKGWVQEHQPDYLLMLIGFNDLGWFVQGPDSLIGNIGELVQAAREAKPDIKILVGNVVHRSFLEGRQDLVDNTNAYNSNLRTRMQSWWRNESPIFYVDVNSNYQCRPESCPDGYDGLHPNAMGEYHIAEAFARVLKNDLGFRLEDFDVPAVVPNRNLEAPGQLVVLPKDEGFEITWSRMEGARGYDLRMRGKGNDAWWSDGPVFPNTFASWWTWALPGETWEFQIRTIGDNDRRSAYTSLATATANPKTSAGPPNIKVVPRDSGIQFTWDADSAYDINRYAVFVWDRDDPKAFIQIFATRSTDYFAGGLVSGHRYSTWVQTWNNMGGNVGGGRPRGARDVRVGGGGVPGAPGINVENKQPTTVRLWWSAVPGAVGYQVYYRNKKDGGDWNLDWTVTNTEHEIGFLFPGTWNFEFTVAAFNGDLEGPKSNVVSPPVYPGYEALPPPASPQHLRVANIDATTVHLSWFSSGNVLGYSIYIRNINDGSTFHQDSQTTNTFQDIGFMFPGTWNYEICVTAFNGQSESPRTDACITPFIYPGYASVEGQPNAPSGVSVANLAPTTVVLSWAPMNDVTGYSVYVKYLADNTLSHDGWTNALSYEIGFLFPGTWNYIVCVTAYRGRVESLYSCVRPEVYPGYGKRDLIETNVTVPVEFTLPGNTTLPGNLNVTLPIKENPDNVGDVRNTGDFMMSADLQSLFKRLGKNVTTLPDLTGEEAMPTKHIEE